MLAGLQDPAIMSRKQAEEQKLRQAVQEKPSLLKEPIGDPWADVAAALKIWDGIYYDWDLLEQRSAFHSQLFGIARTLVRLAEESAKPNADRLREYRESNLESLKFELFSEAPIYDDLETMLLADSLSMLVEMKGYGRSAGPEGPGRQVAAGAGRATGRAARSSRASTSARSWRRQEPEAIRQSTRSDDRTGPARRSPGAEPAQDL